MSDNKIVRYSETFVAPSLRTRIHEQNSMLLMYYERFIILLLFTIVNKSFFFIYFVDFV